MRKYLLERSAFGIIKDTLEIYSRHFLPIFFASLPILPFAYLQDRVLIQDEGAMIKLGAISLNYFVSLFVVSIITIMVSEICLGNKPGLMRAYRRLSPRMLSRMVATYSGILLIFFGGGYLLQAVAELELSETLKSMLMIAIASLTIVFLVLTIYISCVVILEHKWGVKAYQRSLELAKVGLIRNVAFVIAYILIAIFIYRYAFRYMLLRTTTNTSLAFKNILGSLLGPLSSVCIVLLYYDVRVRKEAFDHDSLEDELYQED